MNTSPLLSAVSLQTGIVTAFLCRHKICHDNGQEYTIKKPIEGDVFLSRHGIRGSVEQEFYDDTENALLQYAYDHYSDWCVRLPRFQQLLSKPGAFSENIASLGMTEQNVCIGDIFQVGQAKIQVSYGREACHTMNERFEKADMANEMHRLSRNGWFYRVLEEGYTRAGDAMMLIDRFQPDWNIARVQDIIFGKSLDNDALIALSHMPELANVWKTLCVKRLQTGSIEENNY